MKKVPGLVDFLGMFEGNAGSLKMLTAYLDACARGARGDEVRSLRNRLGDLFPELRAKKLHVRVHKAQRGSRPTETGRLLCPQSRLAEFDADPEGFCKKVLHGQVQIRATSFPSFLYDQKLVVAGRLEPGLLRSGFLVNCYKCVYTGPTSAMSETGRKTAGKPSRAQQMKLSSVGARSIAHVATMPEWSRTDGSFDGQEIFECLVHIFTNQKWARETLAWWDKQKFGAMANRSVTEHGRDEDEAAMDALMAELGADEADTDGEAQG
ncbi:hypothetical protein CERSUDRAFT_96196 [Gelatoporia subvermispora B]|uniref:Uncharacterized protein n=1 Tax=Ceriporiopsis subvermispora (strain B) TaxID=914234 RepID=M2RB24_CERS8|nr:hypothetical protein CERSUDRAFT_96196 [Gelatoporia subvermispora B]